MVWHQVLSQNLTSLFWSESSIAFAELADTMEALSTADISQQLSSTFAHLATLQRKAKQLQDDQAQQDVVTFAGTGALNGGHSGVTSHQSPPICLILYSRRVWQDDRLCPGAWPSYPSSHSTLNRVKYIACIRIAGEMLRSMAERRE